MKQQEISQDTPIPLDSIFFFRTFHLCIPSRHHCMEFFGMRMPLGHSYPNSDYSFLYASLAFEIPSSIQNKMAIMSQSSRSLVNVLSALWPS